MLSLVFFTVRPVVYIVSLFALCLAGWDVFLYDGGHYTVPLLIATISTVSLGHLRMLSSYFTALQKLGELKGDLYFFDRWLNQNDTDKRIASFAREVFIRSSLLKGA